MEPEVTDKSDDGRFLKFGKNPINKGAFKAVFKGRDTVEKQNVAWCELTVDKLQNAWQEKVMNEIMILKELNHPHILRLFGSWEVSSGRDGLASSEKIIVLVTEFMTGGDLKKYRSCNTLVIRDLGRQILKGLRALHTHSPPIIHRDLKCDNIFINKETGLVKIGDLGLATLKNKTYMQTAKGTCAFMAPEMSKKNYNELVDVYAFGMCLLEMSTGEYPYEECDNDLQIYDNLRNGIKPDALNKVTDDKLKRIIEICLAEKKDRCSAESLLEKDFFVESNFTVEVVYRSTEQSRDNGVKILIQSSKKDIECFYDLSCDVPRDFLARQIVSGEIDEKDLENVVNALTEKVEVLKLLSPDKGINGSSCHSVFEPKKDLVRLHLNNSIPQSPSSPLTSPRKVETDDGGSRPRDTLLDDNSSHDNPPQDDSVEKIPLAVSIPTPPAIDTKEDSTKKPVPKDVSEFDWWKKSLPQLTPFIVSSYLNIAIGLHQKHWIDDELYDKIVSLDSGSTEHHRTTLMFHFIQQKLASEDRKTVENTWQALMKALKTEWKQLATHLEQSVNDKKMNKVDALLLHQKKLISLIQGSLNSFATRIYASGALDEAQRDQVTNPHFQCETEYVDKMLKAVGDRIKQDPSVFNEVLKIFESCGGGLKAAVKSILEDQEIKPCGEEDSDTDSVDIKSRKPRSKDLLKLLRDKSAQWYNIGGVLGVSHNDREGLRTDTSINNEGKLENVIVLWLQQNGSLTWNTFIEKLNELKFMDVVKAVEVFLKDPSTIQGYI